MSYKKWGVRAAAIFSAFVITAASSSAFAGFSVKADQLSDLQQQQDALKKKLDEINSSLKNDTNLLNDDEAKIKAIQQKIDDEEALMDIYDSQITQAKSEINKLDTVIAEKEQNISEKQAENEERFQQLRQRLREISKSGNVTALQMLMDTSSYTDYLIKSKVVERIADSDKKLMDELEAEIKQINVEKADVESKKQEQENKKADAQSKKDASMAVNIQLTKDYKTIAALKAQHQADKASDAADQKAKQAELDQTSNQIAAIIQENARKASQSSGTSGGSSSTSYKYDGGTMAWPVPAVHNISSGFGIRWGKLHKGIDISEGPVPVNHQDIVAAADGVVIYANSTNSWGGGYGYYVIIDHGSDSSGRNITTVYAHCSTILCSVGQQVTAGKTVIAKVGKTGDVTGPHLHFEVRVNGTPVDPVKNGYIKAG